MIKETYSHTKNVWKGKEFSLSSNFLYWKKIRKNCKLYMLWFNYLFFWQTPQILQVEKSLSVRVTVDVLPHHPYLSPLKTLKLYTVLYFPNITRHITIKKKVGAHLMNWCNSFYIITLKKLVHQIAWRIWK